MRDRPDQPPRSLRWRLHSLLEHCLEAERESRENPSTYHQRMAAVAAYEMRRMIDETQRDLLLEHAGLTPEHLRDEAVGEAVMAEGVVAAARRFGLPRAAVARIGRRQWRAMRRPGA